jgi:HEAT repeat protein
MDIAHELEGRPLVEWLSDLNSKVGSTRLRATTALLRAGSDVVPKIIETLDGREARVMTSLWGETLLQVVYARFFDDNAPVLQDAYFNERGSAQRALFEAQGPAALDFWIACLCAPSWRVREEAALVLGTMGTEAGRALVPLRDALRCEENEDAHRTMERAVERISGANASLN